MSEPQTTTTEPPPLAGPWQIPSAIGGWLLPGLGHILCGEVKRGVVIMVALISLYVGGLLVGGIDVIDQREDYLWFYAQMGFGPTTWVIDRYHQSLDAQLQQYINNTYLERQAIGDDAPYIKSIGRPNELGTLYCALAGMLNLLAVIDVAYRPRRPNVRVAGASGEAGGVVTREATP